MLIATCNFWHLDGQPCALRGAKDELIRNMEKGQGEAWIDREQPYFEPQLLFLF